MNALKLAESFESFAIDHAPDGWPAVRRNELSDAAAILRKQAEEIERLRKDAGRYQWLRDNNPNKVMSVNTNERINTYFPNWLDDAIDAAMHGIKGGAE